MNCEEEISKIAEGISKRTGHLRNNIEIAIFTLLDNFSDKKEMPKVIPIDPHYM